MSDCNRSECTQKGIWIPRLLVPATGYEVAEGQSETLVAWFRELRVCDDHMEGPEHYLTPEGKAMFVSALRKVIPSAVEPDWAKAEMRYAGAPGL